MHLFQITLRGNINIFLILEPNFGARESLKAWQENSHPWLELSDVCIRTTNNIRVTVIPFYIGVKV